MRPTHLDSRAESRIPPFAANPLSEDPIEWLPVAAFVVDERGQLLQTNAHARYILQRGALCVWNGTLRTDVGCSGQELGYLLKAAMSEVPERRGMLLHRALGNRDLILVARRIACGKAREPLVLLLAGTLDRASTLDEESSPASR